MRRAHRRLQAGAGLCLLLAVALPASAAPFAQGAPAPAPAADTAPGTASANQVAAEVRAGKKQDSRIAAAVAAKLLRQPNLQKVTVEVNAGVVTLAGQAPTDEDRGRAGTLAKQVDGVGDVVNEIQLDADLRTRFDAALNETRGKLVRGVAALPLIAIGLVIVLLSVWLGRVLARRPANWLRAHSHNPYMDGLLRRTLQTVVVLVGIVLALDLLDATTLVSALLGSAGVVGLVLGFGFKDIVENYIAGVLLSIRQPFNPGDSVRIDVHEGKVAALTSRSTQLVTADGNELTLPNALVFKSVMLNYTRNPRRRFDFATNVTAGASWNEAMDLGIRTMRGIDGVLADPAPSALIKDLADTAATIQYFGWIDQTRNDLAKTRSEAMRLVRRRLREAGITPPEGVQKITLHRTEAQAGGDAASRETTQARDTSVDRTLDAQVSHREHDDANLLQPTAGTPPG